MTTSGSFVSSTVPSYFIRVSKTGDPNAAISYGLGNGSITADQRSVIDAGFLELVRLGVLPASDPIVQSSLTVVDDTIERTTPNGAGFYRYGTSADGVRRRLRRLLPAEWFELHGHRRSVAADGHRDRPPVAGAQRRAR